MKTAPGFEHDRKHCLPTKSSRLFPFGFDKNKPFGYLFGGLSSQGQSAECSRQCGGR